ncbi:MAG: AAA family ATPase [Kofleriaceae bacterium]|nr:AAA family ATPase [Kofleriaceae bacterium]
MTISSYRTAAAYRLDRIDLATAQLLAAFAGGAQGAVDAARERIAARVEASAATAPLSVTMGGLLGMTPEEVEVMWLLATLELEPSLATHLPPTAPTELTAQHLRQIVFAHDPARAVRALAPEAPLLRYGLLTIPPTHLDQAPSRRVLRVTDRALTLTLGDEGLDAGTTPLRATCAAATGVPDPRALAAMAARTVTVLPGVGADLSALAAALAGTGAPLLALDLNDLNGAGGAAVRVALCVLAREARLSRSHPVLLALDPDDAARDERDGLRAAIERELIPLVDGPVFITTTSAKPLSQVAFRGRTTSVLEIVRPAGADAAACWSASLGVRADATVVTGASERFTLSAPQIAAVADAACASSDGPVSIDAVQRAVRATFEPALGAVANRVETKQTWNDFVAPSEQYEQLVELAARVRQRRLVLDDWGFGAKVGKGCGVAALLSGPPGTGKTMVAGLLARELGLDLYQVDLSKVVSKYIGETEKHLAAVFDAAEAGHAILLFDEADSLFGKRTEVKSSNDRYANLETNYLLQRLERFTGVCILTTNHEQAIDEAFRRRLALHIRLPAPEQAQRAQLWEALLPARAAVTGPINFAALARAFPMSGGYIKNAVLRAAYLAADEGSPITAAHLTRAGQLELEAMGKVVVA